MKNLVLNALMILTVLLATVSSLQAKVRLSGVFADHMVLQRDTEVPVWGWADSGETVTVEFAGQKKTATARADGYWKVNLDALAASAESRELHVIGKSPDETQVVSDIVVGDVWLCSGQSNMEFAMSGLKGTKYEGDLATANYPLIRQGTVARRPSVDPQPNVAVHWTNCTPGSVAAFTAAGFYFAREVQHELGVPVGLLFSAWGGTSADSWTSLPALGTVPDFKTRADIQLANLAALPERIKKFPAAIAVWEAANGRVDNKNAGEQNGWQNVDISPSGWQTSKINSPWRGAGLTNGGIAWLRKEVGLPASVAGKNFHFDLGLIDDQYVTAYWNGEKLGESGRKAPEFYYGYVSFNVPPKLLHPGKNIFALRFTVNTGDKSPFNRHALDLGFLNLGLNELSDECLVKVEREFPPLPATALAARPATPKGDAAHTSGALFGGIIQPLVPFAIKGTLWYQGEQDAGRASIYATLLSLMIHDWRTRWGWDFPVVIQQLPNWDAGDPDGTSWARQREAQALVANILTNCFLSVAIDIGESNNVHPKNKREIGRRLALVALANIYHRTNDFCGPVYDSMKVEGAAIRLQFKPADVLKSLDGEPLRNFVIAGADHKFVPAEARIDGTALLVFSTQVSAPVAVRYAFLNNPERCNFSNASDLPALPFRTDNWPNEK